MAVVPVLTCQCLVTAFQTPILPVWLVAMSWFPTKKRASTGTPRWKTPELGEYNQKEAKETRSCQNPPGSSRWKGQEWFLTDLAAIAVGLQGPEDDLAARRHRHHLVVVTQSSTQHLGIEGHPFDHPVQAGTGEDLLPPRRLLHPGDKQEKMAGHGAGLVDTASTRWGSLVPPPVYL